MTRKVPRDILIGILITIGLLLLGEAAVRTYVHVYLRRVLLDEWEIPDTALGWKPRPNFRKGGVEINSLGFRGGELSVRKATETFRIVAMGDSTTFGYGETRLAPYPAQLEAILNQRADSCGIRYEVVNAGVEGYSARHVWARLEKEVLRLEPNLLIIYVGWNNLYDVDPERGFPTMDPHSWFNRLLRVSYLLKAATKVAFERTLPAREEVTEKRVAQYRQFVPAAFLEEYRRIIQTARSRGVAITISTLPSLLGVQDWERSREILHYPRFTARPDLLRILWERYNQSIRGLATEMDVPLLDLAEGIRQVKSARTLFMDTLHFNTPGYRAVAEIMARELCGAGLLPCPGNRCSQVFGPHDTLITALRNRNSGRSTLCASMARRPREARPFETGAPTISSSDDKREAMKQWTHDPCGLSGALGLEVGTQGFYERADWNRYEEYAPRMQSTLEFNRFPGKRLFGVGFGMGTDLFQFASAGAIVSGVDLSPVHLQIASRRVIRAGIPADLRLADPENLPFEEASFDAVYSFPASLPARIVPTDAVQDRIPGAQDLPKGAMEIDVDGNLYTNAKARGID